MLFPSFIYLFISIHAPAKGATNGSHVSWYPNLISIHAPAKGATFSPDNMKRLLLISIHAPAKGATRDHHECVWCRDISIHAPAKGATRKCAKLTTITLFQSTLPRRERLLSPIASFSFFNFNPRSREGSDVADFLDLYQ